MILSIPLTILVSWASFALYESPISEFGKRLIRSMKEEQLVIASGVGIRTSETEVPAEP
jgi:peptidoglycan/LPS O-acetylase OafA/YrhL